MLKTQRFSLIAAAGLTAAIAVLPTMPATAGGDRTHATGPFKGAKVNGGTVTHAVENGKDILILSDDFQSPDTPAPHWQIVDSHGNAYLLQRLKVKAAMPAGAPDKLNKTIAVPPYIRDIAKVQIWCAWAETLLGETSFDSVITLGSGMSSPEAHVRTSSMFQGVKANTGTVTHSHQGGQRTLALSEDFKAPDAPAPHWQVVDSQGNVYLLQSLNIKGVGAGSKMNRSIVVPCYVPDIVKVQMWCAYAEVLLGEASFDSPVM